MGNPPEGALFELEKCRSFFLLHFFILELILRAPKAAPGPRAAASEVSLSWGMTPEVCPCSGGGVGSVPMSLCHCLCPPWLQLLAQLQRAFPTPLSQLNKTQPQTYSKHLLVFKENNSV